MTLKNVYNLHLHETSCIKVGIALWNLYARNWGSLFQRVRSQSCRTDLSFGNYVNIAKARCLFQYNICNITFSEKSVIKVHVTINSQLLIFNSNVLLHRYKKKKSTLKSHSLMDNQVPNFELYIVKHSQWEP